MQNIYSDKELRELIKVETELSSLAFSVSESLGREAVRSAVSNFLELLRQQKGRIIPAMDLDYRIFIVGFLEALLNIVDDKHRSIVVSEIIFPS